ncbi:peptide deformylase [Candidatus Woesebacteria bacterium]|nr:peptide deformylase [Candidatus Woesebacteria bacterium]
MIRKILQAGDPLLRKKSKPVGGVDKKILKLVRDLKDTLAIQKDPEGVGLAAPQIGKGLKIFLINHKGLEKVIINPEVLEIGKTKGRVQKTRGKQIMEGCLSLPNFYGPIKRAPSLKLRYLNGEGRVVIEEFKDFFAQIILHEIDHLEGVLFVDRLLEQKKPLYKLVKDEWEEVEI